MPKTNHLKMANKKSQRALEQLTATITSVMVSKTPPLNGTEFPVKKGTKEIVVFRDIKPEELIANQPSASAVNMAPPPAGAPPLMLEMLKK